MDAEDAAAAAIHGLSEDELLTGLGRGLPQDLHGGSCGKARFYLSDCTNVSMSLSKSRSTDRRFSIFWIA